MKRITNFFVLTFLTSLAFGQSSLSSGEAGVGIYNPDSNRGTEQVLSHSLNSVPAEGSVACGVSASGHTVNNSYWRTYTLSDFSISGDKSVVGVEFGYSFADNGGLNPDITAVVNVYSVSGGAFPAGTNTLIATGTGIINAAGNLSVLRVDMDTAATVTDSEEIAIEVVFPSGETEILDIRLGQNADGETAPTYISTPDCGGITPTTFTGIGFPGNGVINLIVDDVLSVEERFAAQVRVFPNPVNDLLSVDFPATAEVTGFKLFDILGRDTGLKMVNGTVNTANLSNGIYLLSLETTEGNFTTRILKQ